MNMSSHAGVLSVLSITGLTLVWFSTYVIVCAVNGQLPSVTEVDAPSRLFDWGGVFGMQRPTLEVIWRVVCAGWLGIGALCVCDFFYARHTQARWFALHVIANGWISLLCLPDLYLIVTDPIRALSNRETVNHWPTSLVFSIHVYHMLFFRNLQFIDWLHHILMVVIGAPLLITGEMGHLMNFNHFFMCGLPGGADYAMLFAVKHGWMSPLSEKKYNAAINVWIREPALVSTASLGFIQMHLQPSLYSTPINCVRIFLCALATWNGLFFMERVVGNYHVCAYKERQANKPDLKHADASERQKGDAPAPPPEAFSYESEEHFSTSLPGLGMRVSVSAQELTQIPSQQQHAIKPPPARRVADAYPASQGPKKTE